QSLNARMDELGRELQGALERAEQEGRRSRIFVELAGSIDLEEVLSRTLEAAGEVEGADAALLMLPDGEGGKPLVATLGLSVEEAERHAITGPPDGRLARAITMSYTYPELEPSEGNGENGIIHSGLTVPLPGEVQTLAYLTVFTRSKAHEFSEEDVRELESLALHAGPAACRPGRADGTTQPALLPRDALARVCARPSLRAEAVSDRLRPRRLQGGQRPHRPPRRRRCPRGGSRARQGRRAHVGHRVPRRRRRVRGHPPGVVAGRRRPVVQTNSACRLDAAARPGREAVPLGRRRRVARGGRPCVVLPARRPGPVQRERSR